MTYPEAIAFLYNLRLFGTKFGLENTRELARLNGNPQEKLRFIHVAGTNGKGSTCAILESIYRSHGLRTGLFTSPHLVSFTERMQVNRESISEKDVSMLTHRAIDSLGSSDLEQWPFRPTFFEFITVMALLFFCEQNCDLVIWETGMGGRLDATNIVTPLASVITNVQLDHQQWLGNSIETIAAEKAGIIKPGIPVITAAEGRALDVIRSTAKQQGAPLTILEGSLVASEQIRDLPLLGEHQRINAKLALTVVTALAEQLPVTNEAVQRGIQNVFWPGRLQLVERGSSRILMDGAHNPDGAKTLALSIAAYFKDQPITLILGLFRDKAWEEMCDILVPCAQRLLLVPVSSDRTANAAEVEDYCRKKWPGIDTHQCSSLKQALEETVNHPFAVIAGSLHLVGEAMELLHVLPAARSERSLNEWDAANSANAV